jgi:hypothetical protein
MRQEFSTNFLHAKDAVLLAVENFAVAGENFVEGKRNVIRIFPLGTEKMNIKSFRIPNFVNKILYRYVRKSKARRSFEFAQRLAENGIGTPQPIAYIEKHDAVGVRESYYVSEHLEADLTFRELVSFPDYPEHETILRQFTAFSYELHQKGIEFLDHSPGNTLIRKIAGQRYAFYLVDLNRMKFHDVLSFEKRMKNLSRLTPKKEMVAVMSSEYARLSGEDETKVFETLWKFTSEFQHRFHRKKKMKKKLLGK